MTPINNLARVFRSPEKIPGDKGPPGSCILRDSIGREARRCVGLGEEESLVVVCVYNARCFSRRKRRCAVSIRVEHAGVEVAGAESPISRDVST